MKLGLLNVKAAQSKGKVFICCLSHLRQVPKENNFVFMTTRGKRSVNGVRQTSELAPSRGLFNKYSKDWKLSENKNWWPTYRKQYLKELDYTFIDKLKVGLDDGKNIPLMCFCGDETYCHRTLLKELFSNLNYETISY